MRERRKVGGGEKQRPPNGALITFGNIPDLLEWPSAGRGIPTGQKETTRKGGRRWTEKKKPGGKGYFEDTNLGLSVTVDDVVLGFP